VPSRPTVAVVRLGPSTEQKTGTEHQNAQGMPPGVRQLTEAGTTCQLTLFALGAARRKLQQLQGRSKARVANSKERQMTPCRSNVTVFWHFGSANRLSVTGPRLPSSDIPVGRLRMQCAGLPSTTAAYVEKVRPQFLSLLQTQQLSFNAGVLPASSVDTCLALKFVPPSPSARKRWTWRISNAILDRAGQARNGISQAQLIRQ